MAKKICSTCSGLAKELTEHKHWHEKDTHCSECGKEMVKLLGKEKHFCPECGQPQTSVELYCPVRLNKFAYWFGSAFMHDRIRLGYIKTGGEN